MRFLLALVLTSVLTPVRSQKYNFVNWTVEDGLVQSQASFICQDSYRQLWIGTEGGISRFDGKRFRSYTVQDGLPGNHVSCIQSSGDSILWIGTSNGLVRFNGTAFSEQHFDSDKPSYVRAVVRSDKITYALASLKVYQLEGYGAKRTLVSGDSSEKITALEPAGDGRMIASVYGKGIYTGSGNEWRLAAPLTGDKRGLVIFKCLVSQAGDTLLACDRGLLVIRRGYIEPYLVNDRPPVSGVVLCMAEDDKRQLWIGTEKGACKISGNTVTYFTGQSGLTDNSVNHIYNDEEGNLWFATNADGIFKFRENTFTYYDKSAGLNNPIVMGVDQLSDGKIFLAGYGGGLFYTEGGQLLAAPGCEELRESKINTIYADRKDMIWVGTLNRGIFRYDPVNKKLHALGKHDVLPAGATTFCEDTRGNVLIGSGQGLFASLKNGASIAPAPDAGLISALMPFDRDHIMMGTAHGVYLIDTSFNVVPFQEEKLGKTLVMCLARQGNHLFIGTSDQGIYLFDLKTLRLTNYNTADGLPNNFIYSIDASEKNRLWAGTGFGISRVDLDHAGEISSIKNYGRADGLLGMECNHNSLLRASDGGLWFGTTKGLFHFDPQSSAGDGSRPLVLLRSVKLFSSPVDDTSLYASEGHWFDVPKGLRLASRQNHLTFELGAMYFTNPDDILYRYKLEGIDKGFTASNNPIIIYPSLPPGKYTLKVKALTKGGVASINEVTYPFEISKAFYQTSLFQVMVIVVLVGSGALIAWLITRARHKRRQREKELHERIREEEFGKLRQRTAEDFHDEMGNSLTRISVLTDVLKVKLNGTEKEVSHLVQQIKDNTTALYNGSRDIIWSLDARNDALYEIAEHIKDIGNEIFQDTPVEFRYSHNIPSGNTLRLKLDYSRNLTMVFKEAYANILKHARASRVNVDISLDENKVLSVSLADNGDGFSADDGHGNGLKNMENRVRRMRGDFNLTTSKGNGTEIRILLDDLFVN